MNFSGPEKFSALEGRQCPEDGHGGGATEAGETEYNQQERQRRKLELPEVK